MTDLAVGQRVWWHHTPSLKLCGSIVEPGDRPAVRQHGRSELIHLDADQLHVGTPDGWHRLSGYVPEPERLSPHGALKLLKSPQRFDYDRSHPSAPTKAFEMGHAVHRLVLGEGEELAVLDPAVHGLKRDGTLADNPAATAGWKTAVDEARANGQVPIHIDEFATATAMADRVHAHPEAGPLLADGHAETWLYATEPETGQPIRLRTDFMTWRDGRLWILDYKTMKDASREAFRKDAYKFGYYMQFVFTITAVRALELGDGPPVMVFVCQEKDPPYDVAVYEMDVDFWRLGVQRMHAAARLFQHCTALGEWPGYPPKIQSVGPPAWAFRDDWDNSILTDDNKEDS